ncbi:hypothetical protein B5M47_00880 [candidate division CPR3 bacterium 4484_211]|uniref:ATP-grasp domain-containing protein n=1 Tax=candidate division CPR3 bacterium 4484_211 TaxID=1968527 RepID=A0A1W9NZ32_UNCC3|nr:MAG: hypothetical protein B5M47_00880 [candidate division CPR3 bacterium 4484_211]
MLDQFATRLQQALWSRSLAAIHTRPILYNLVNFGLLPEPNLELTTIGRGRARLSVTLDKPGQPTPDLVFDPEGTHLPLLWDWMLSNPNGVLVGPYILYSSVFTRGAWDGFRTEADRLSKKRGLVQVYVPFRVTKLIEPKKNFAPILQGAGVDPPHFIEGTTPQLPEWEEVRSLFREKCVVQTDDSAGGSGTRIVGVYHTWSDAVHMLREAGPGMWYRVVEFVEGYETNGQAVVLPGGVVLVDPLSHKPSAGQISHITGGKPQGAVGDDWTNPWPERIQVQYLNVMVRVGQHLHQEFGYIGIFGIDFIIDLEGERVVPHEINARYQGTSFSHDRRALMKGRPSTFGLWLLAASGEEDFSWLRPEEYNRQSVAEAGGWQFDIHPLPEAELPLPVVGNMNGWWKWEAGRLVPANEKTGQILCWAARPGQVFTKRTRAGDPRLLAPAQVYSWGGLPAIFHSSQEELTIFGQQIIPAARKVMFG